METSLYPSRPPWLKKRLPRSAESEKLKKMLSQNRLHTVCQHACCPNLWECFSRQTATFMILGSACTRNCRFCAVSHGAPDFPDPTEPDRVAGATHNLGLHYTVITSVTRDDLPDGGASVFAATLNKIRQINPGMLVEVLIPDFRGDPSALKTVVEAQPNVVNHNIETVARLYTAVRPQARYRRSLQLLKQVQKYDAKIVTKSGLMLGLGETSDEIHATLQDLLAVRWMQKRHIPVARFASPAEFDNWREIALAMGFDQVASGPFVRSSYQAHKLYQAIDPVPDY